MTEHPAVVQFTRAPVPSMIAAAKGSIVNLAGVAGVIPGRDTSSLPTALWLSVDQVAAGSLRDLEKGRVLSVPGVQYKALTTVAGLIPRTLAARLNRGLFNARGRT
ncbi:hypothetical protein [Nocardia brasiliensis]|uniref:hypothetical protein n=1 Tax=Nocardia brasiliensis TaxID=37326 RepID=UPI00366DABC9